MCSECLQKLRAYVFQRKNNSWIVVFLFSRHHFTIYYMWGTQKDFFLLFILCIVLQSMYHLAYALRETLFMTYHLLRVLAPSCHPQ